MGSEEICISVIHFRWIDEWSDQIFMAMSFFFFLVSFFLNIIFLPSLSPSYLILHSGSFFFSLHCYIKPMRSTCFFISHQGYWICLLCREECLNKAEVMRWNQPHFSSSQMNRYRLNPTQTFDVWSLAPGSELFDVCSILGAFYKKSADLCSKTHRDEMFCCIYSLELFLHHCFSIKSCSRNDWESNKQKL